MPHEFLHRHPWLEEKGINDIEKHRHCVVDEDDYETVMKLLSSARKQRDIVLSSANPELLSQDFSDALKRCNKNFHR